MTREIEFRGFDGTKWYYGDLEYNKKTGVARIHTYEEDGSYCRQYTVDPDTVGQFTGMRDKNGRKIYESDILRSPLGNIVVVEFGYKEHIVNHGRPYIIDSFACYGWIAKNLRNGITDFFDNEFAAGEIIGNIYDNPELLDNKSK